MSALQSKAIIDYLYSLQNLMPWVSFAAGIGGSLHCVGMCGGLVTATCQSNQDVFRYQIGRLAGYITLGFFAAILGQIFSIQVNNPKLALIPGITIGLLFLYWGIQNLTGKKAEIPTPKFFTKIYSSLWIKFVHRNETTLKPLATGLMSIFLPCGLLYSMVLSLAAIDHSFKAVYSMFFFWLGTLPSMVLAPNLLQRILRPLKARLPKTYAISLIVMGLMTISFRVVRFQNTNANFQIKTEKKSTMQCH